MKKIIKKKKCIYRQEKILWKTFVLRKFTELPGKDPDRVLFSNFANF